MAWYSPYMGPVEWAHSKLNNVDTCKIVKWSYDQQGRSQFNQVYMRHFCRRCASKIDRWIKKHKEV